jgi:hypothetical protein
MPEKFANVLVTRVYLLSLPTRFFTRRLTSSFERLLNCYARPTIRTGLSKWGASTACTVWNIRLGVWHCTSLCPLLSGVHHTAG